MVQRIARQRLRLTAQGGVAAAAPTPSGGLGFGGPQANRAITAEPRLKLSVFLDLALDSQLARPGHHGRFGALCGFLTDWQEIVAQARLPQLDLHAQPLLWASFRVCGTALLLLDVAPPQILHDCREMVRRQSSKLWRGSSFRDGRRGQRVRTSILHLTRMKSAATPVEGGTAQPALERTARTATGTGTWERSHSSRKHPLKPQDSSGSVHSREGRKILRRVQYPGRLPAWATVCRCAGTRHLHLLQPERRTGTRRRPRRSRVGGSDISLLWKRSVTEPGCRKRGNGEKDNRLRLSLRHPGLRPLFSE